MINKFNHFLKGLTTYTAIVLVAGALLFSTILKEYFLPIFPVVLVFYYLSTLLLHNYMIKIAKSDVSRFSFKFMVLSFVKMFIYIVFGVIYIIFDEIHAVIFLIVYLILYVAYAVYEVRSVMKLINETKA